MELKEIIDYYFSNNINYNINKLCNNIKQVMEHKNILVLKKYFFQDNFSDFITKFNNNIPNIPDNILSKINLDIDTEIKIKRYEDIINNNYLNSKGFTNAIINYIEQGIEISSPFCQCGNLKSKRCSNNSCKNCCNTCNYHIMKK